MSEITVRQDVLDLLDAAMSLAERDPAAGLAEADRIRFRVVGRRAGRGIAVRHADGYRQGDLDAAQDAARYARDLVHLTQNPHVTARPERPTFATAGHCPLCRAAACRCITAAR